MKKLKYKKPDGKWWTYGSMKEWPNGGTSVSFLRKDLEQLLQDSAGGGDWINFSVWDEKPKEEKPSQHEQQKQDGYQPQEALDSEIPF